MEARSMTVAVETSGSLTADGTEQQFNAAATSAAVRVLVVDAANMADGDVTELRIYGKARSGDTERLIYIASFANTQTVALKESIPVPTPHYFRATLKQIAGTNRAYPWAIYTL
jgi:hypothetical protein